MTKDRRCKCGHNATDHNSIEFSCDVESCGCSNFKNLDYYFISFAIFDEAGLDIVSCVSDKHPFIFMKQKRYVKSESNTYSSLHIISFQKITIEEFNFFNDNNL